MTETEIILNRILVKLEKEKDSLNIVIDNEDGSIRNMLIKLQNINDEINLIETLISLDL